MRWLCFAIVLAFTSCMTPPVFNGGDPGPRPDLMLMRNDTMTHTRTILRDPASARFTFGDISTRDGYWLLRYQVRARNGFGGYSVEDWRARFAAGRLVALERGRTAWSWNTPYTKWRTVVRVREVLTR